ncbi:MAG TPA: ABC transporter substrate-binding protein [Burkholderiales bacterium]|jgi:branched-chain amino acid transport system substrate-binding protein|nr:ABC transporter substrate-binding protein [Burkholderiales bacterium]
MQRNRRTVIKSIGAAAASAIGAPYLNLAHAQGTPIPIGVGLPMTGNAGAYGPDMAEAAKRTAAKINAAGGVLGRKLELFIEDSESSAAVAANLTQKFINVHKAQSCIGYWGTPEGMSSRPIAIQNKTVLMVSSAANAITEGDTQGYVWRFQMKATDWGIVISRATIDKLGFKSVGVMGLQNAFVLPIMKVFEEKMKAAGRTVTDSLIYNPEQPSYRAEVERIFGKKPDAVFCFGLLPDFVSIMKEVYRGGFESKVVALSIMADAEGKFVQAVGPQVAEGIRHFQPMPDVSAPGYKRFLQLMGAPADRVYLFPPNTHDQLAITALAMEKAKSPMAVDWHKEIITVGNGPGQAVDDIAEALKLVKAGKPVNFQGAGSTCDFTPNGDQIGRGMGQWIIKGGKSVFVEYAKP